MMTANRPSAAASHAIANFFDGSAISVTTSAAMP